MKPFLMFADRDGGGHRLPPNADEIRQDLELDALLDAMAGHDSFVRQVAEKSVLMSLGEPEHILYRQAILADFINHRFLAREIYEIAVEAMKGPRKSYLSFFIKNSPESIVRESRTVLALFAEQLKKLRLIADQYAGEVESAGLQRFFAMLQRELDDSFLAAVAFHLEELDFRDGILISARLGKKNGGIDYVLRRREPLPLIDRVLGKGPTAYTFHLHHGDQDGPGILSDIKGRALNLVANALAQSADHILSFFTLLRTEVAFYAGCLNLYEQLDELGQPVCFPVPVAAEQRDHTATGLYDPCLALIMRHAVVANDLDAQGKDLALITGANQGGKTTFLRSIGLSQLMMQCGMFVPAKSFRANLCTGVFTHFKREEDQNMNSGKLDEEFRRMATMADQLSPHGMVLFNESFAPTNEHEGSEIAAQIVEALVDSRVKVFFVTHLYGMARWLFERDRPNVLFLRAERITGGRRTYRIIEGEPLPTSFGEDLYHRIFDTVSEADLAPGTY